MRKLNKIVFLMPNTRWFGGRYWHHFPYVIGLLFSVIKQHGYDLYVIDANIDDLSEEAVKKKIADEKPDLVMVSAMTIMYRRMTHTAFRLIKEVDKNIISVVGGIYPTQSLNMIIKDPNIDFIVSGEAEERLPQLLQAIEAGSGFDKLDGVSYKKDGSPNFTINASRAFIQNLDSIPFPDYSLVDVKKYSMYGQKYTQNFQFRQFPFAETMSSRGCSFKCTFCSSNDLYAGRPTIRYRSPQNVLAEIDMLVKTQGTRELIFLDDSFLQSKKRFMEIMQGIIDRQYGLLWKSNNLSIFLMDEEVVQMMKKSGCYQLNVSIESGSQRTLDAIKKPVKLHKISKTIQRIKDAGIELTSNFVIGFPHETMEDIRETFKYAEEIDIDLVLFSIATPLPATELYDEAISAGALPEDFNLEEFEFYGFGRGVITTPEFTPWELQVMRAFEWDRINFKTQAKKEKICSLLGINMEELNQWRKDTRRALGVDVKSSSDFKLTTPGEAPDATTNLKVASVA